MSIRLFIGWPGFGKSLAMQDMAADAALEGHIVYTVDRASEWAPEATDTEGRSRWRNAPPVINESPQEYEGEDLVKALCELRDKPQKERGCVVRFGFPHDGFSVGELARRVGNVIVADDEADYTSSRGNWEAMHKPDSAMRGFSLNPYRDFVHRGRHLPSPDDYVPREVHLLGAMRRPENVHTDLTSIAEEVMMFRIGGHTTFDRILKEGWLLEDDLPELMKLEKLNYFLHVKGKDTVRGYVEGLK